MDIANKTSIMKVKEILINTGLRLAQDSFHVLETRIITPSRPIARAIARQPVKNHDEIAVLGPDAKQVVGVPCNPKILQDKAWVRYHNCSHSGAPRPIFLEIWPLHPAQ